MRYWHQAIRQVMDKEKLLETLGFRFGTNGPHAARTMMFHDLQTLFAHIPSSGLRIDYAEAIVNQNLLGKPTKKARELAFRHMATLYGLDPSNSIFRALRRLWPLDDGAQPILALMVALARDPLLRGTQSFILEKQLGMHVPREEMEHCLAELNPERFSPASLKSFAQNVSGTWTSAGFLIGRQRKVRSTPVVRPENVAMALFLGYLEGRTGQRLFTSEWMQLLSESPDALESLTNSASHRGQLVFLNAGGVKEVRFPDYLTQEEEHLHQEVTNVI